MASFLDTIKQNISQGLNNSGGNVLEQLAANGSVQPETAELWRSQGMIAPSPQVMSSEQAMPAIATDIQNTPVQPQQLEVYNPQPIMEQPVAQVPVDMGSMDKYQQQIDNAAAIGNRAAAEEMAYANAYDKKIEEENLKEQQRLDDITARVDEGLQKAQEKLDQIANQEIDPNRVFKDMSVGKKIGLALLAGIAGDKGTATLDRMIDQDIKAQENLKSSQLESAKNASSMYKDLFDLYQNRNAARIALKGVQYQAAQVKLKALESQTQNAEMKAKFAGMNAEIEAKKQELAVKLNEELMKKSKMQSLKVDPVYEQIHALPISDAQKAQLFEAKEVQDATKAAFNTIDTIFEESKSIGPIAGNLPFSDAKATVEANNANIESAIRATMKGQGTIQESEIERLVKPLLPLPTDTKSVIEIKKQKLKTLLLTKNAGQIGRLRNFGLVSQEFTPKTAKPN